MQNGKHMGPVGLTIFASVWTTLAWIGMDMYLPALPILHETFPASDVIINLTLLTYSIAMPVGNLIGGPISDKTGRKAPMLVGALLYLVATLACGFAPGIWFLIVVRVFAGLGAGIIGSVVMAVVKDELEGNALDTAFTWTQSLTIIGPIAGPFLGSLMINLVGWRGIFFLIAILVAIMTIPLLVMAESLPQGKRADVGLVQSLGLLVKVAKDGPFTLFLLVVCTTSFSFGCFLTLSSYIFIDFFGLSNMGFSVYYGIIMAFSFVAPFIYLFQYRRTSMTAVVFTFLGALTLSGILILAVGKVSPFLFFVAVIPFVIAEGMARPAAYTVLLRRAEDNAGAASSLIGFATGVMASAATPLVSLSAWKDHVVACGWPVLAVSLVGFALLLVLLFVLRSDILKAGSADADAQ